MLSLHPLTMEGKHMSNNMEYEFLWDEATGDVDAMFFSEVMEYVGRYMMQHLPAFDDVQETLVAELVTRMQEGSDYQKFTQEG
jgi:hypothetical protein